MTSTAVITKVNALTNNDFSSTQVQAALEVAYDYAMGKTGDNITLSSGSDWSDYVIAEENHSSVIAGFAMDILMNARNITKNRTDSVQIYGLDELWIKGGYSQMLLVGDEQNEDVVTSMWSSDNPTEDWVV